MRLVHHLSVETKTSCAWCVCPQRARSPNRVYVCRRSNWHGLAFAAGAVDDVGARSDPERVGFIIIVAATVVNASAVDEHYTLSAREQVAVDECDALWLGAHE